ncbi:MAG: archease [Candidatus Nanohaloarchaeota archaeon QJJ-9]|nr:archease [Candidatus Nanohaloarchaeota archaeon QJJ-9]
MQDFKILEHKADAKFQTYGKNLEEAFENAGKALFSVMTDLEKIGLEKEVSFVIEAESREALLYEFLDHLIYLKDVENAVFKGFKVNIEKEKEQYRLEAAVKGRKIEEINVKDAKAMTYSEMEIREGEEGFTLQAVVDM